VSGLDSLANVREILQYDQPLAALCGFLHDCLADIVVDVFHMSSFSA
jgi:hypothetical protein